MWHDEIRLEKMQILHKKLLLDGQRLNIHQEEVVVGGVVVVVVVVASQNNIPIISIFIFKIHIRIFICPN